MSWSSSTSRLAAVDQLIVLNGAQGLSEVLAQALSQGATGLKMARGLLGSNGLGGDGADEAKANGHVEVTAKVPAEEPAAE